MLGGKNIRTKIMGKILGLFPGQGSQSVGMGAEFINSNECARELFAQADQALRYPLTQICLNGPLETLTLTENAQPAILTASYVCFLLSGLSLDAAAGHSLGEYTALVSAKALSFTDAVTLVHKRGRYMQEAVPTGEGKMVAVMGPSEEEIQEVISGLNNGVVEIANLNSPGQTVVAGNTIGVESFSTIMSERGGKIIPLNVSAPFHCRLMKPAAERLALDLDAISFSDPVFPVYANVTARPITSGNDARELLKKQVCATVRWTDSMVAVLETEAISDAVEFGAGGVLTKLLKRINKNVNRHEVADPASLEKTKAALP